MNNQAAQTMPELPRPALITARGRTGFTDDQMHQYARDYAAALAQTAGVHEPGRYFAGGPQGHFFADDLQLARDLVNLYDKDDDWTITDLRNPTGAAPAASGGVDYDEVWLLLKSAQTNIGACRPDWDADDAEHWDRLTAAMESVKAASIKQHGSINRPLVSDDSQNVAASVSERARALLAQAYRDGGFPFAAETLLSGRTDSLDECALVAVEQALTQQRGTFNPSLETLMAISKHTGVAFTKVALLAATQKLQENSNG